MPDFLDNLVERSFGLAPLLQRRKPSLFEARTGSVPEFLEVVRQRDAAIAPARDELAAVGELPEFRREVPAQQGGPAQHPRDEGTAQPPPISQERLHVAVPPAEQMRVPPSLSAVRLEPVREVVHVHPSVIEHQHTERIESHHEHTIERHFTERTVLEERAVRVVERAATPAETPFNEHRPAHVPSPSARPPTRPSLPAAADRQTERIRERNADTPRAPDSAPPVHVTIGRIEVRAASPPQTAQRPRVATPAKPRVSLDDYLATRGRERA